MFIDDAEEENSNPAYTCADIKVEYDNRAEAKLKKLERFIQENMYEYIRRSAHDGCKEFTMDGSWLDDEFKMVGGLDKFSELMVARGFKVSKVIHPPPKPKKTNSNAKNQLTALAYGGGYTQIIVSGWAE